MRKFQLFVVALFLGIATLSAQSLPGENGSKRIQSIRNRMEFRTDD